MQSFLAVRMMPSFAFMMALATRGKAWAIICYLILLPAFFKRAIKRQNA
jgi:hypothetical protein